ncbi:hypothetical protein, variant [Aphanomyces invadans]|nr:hypothetical protein, variant [Aphanomyces invadans]ETV90875.1 hypothetical protein, variant [Aphanomyces invadans]|eukprot:XP_008880440.1 hypothetical protein, variant [Aphanomyces invadans]
MILTRKLPSRWATELCMGYMAYTIVADDVVKDVADTIDSILELLGAYLANGTILPDHEDWLAFDTVLDVLPPLLTVSSATTAFFPTVLDAILALPWSVQSFPSLLSFCRSHASHVTPHHHAQLHALFHKFLPAFSSQAKYPFWHAVLLACFDLTEHALVDRSGDDPAGVQWMHLARRAMTLLPTTLHREMDYFLHTVLQHKPVYIARWLRSAMNKAARAGDMSTEWDLTMCVHCLHASQPLVVQPVLSTGGGCASTYHQLGLLFVDTVAAIGASSIRRMLQRVLVHGSHWKGRVLLDLAKCLLGASLARDQVPPNAQIVWTALLDVLFQEVVELRSDMIGFVLAGFESSDDFMQEVAETALSSIVTEHHRLLQPHLPDLQDRVCRVCQSSIARGTRLIRACDPLVATTPSYYHFLVVLLRKTLVSPCPEVAIAHLCHLLQAPSTTTVQKEDLVSCLNDALYLTSCRHLALAYLESLPDVLPYERAILDMLSTLVEVDGASGVRLRMDQLDAHSGFVFRQCVALLPRLSTSTRQFGQLLTTQLKAVVSRSHCRAFLDAAPDRVRAAAFYARVAVAVGMTALHCRILTSLPSTSKAPQSRVLDDPSTAELVNGLVGGCCAHWSLYCLHLLDLRLPTLSSPDLDALAKQSVALYLTWYNSDVIAEHDPHAMPELKLPVRKPIKPHEILTCVLKLWPSLVCVVTPELWGATSWKPVCHALLAQLEPLLDTQRHIGLSVAIAEYLHAMWTTLDPSLRRSGAKRVYRFVCTHVISSPKLLSALLDLVWLDAMARVHFARVVAVLREAQSTNDQSKQDDDTEYGLAAPVLTTDATRKTAYADGLRQLEHILAASETPNVDDLVTLGQAAWRRPSIAYSHASRAMDAWLRVGRGALAVCMASGQEAFRLHWGRLHTIVRICMDVGAAWKHVTELADATVRMQRFLLDVSSKSTRGMKKRVWHGTDAVAVKQLIQAVSRHVMELVDRPKPHKWPPHEPKRKRSAVLRSRHAYIDDCLQEQESGDDAYADLEDFIVE